MELYKIDYQLLAYISKSKQVHIKKLLKKFPDEKYQTHERLRNLCGYENNTPAYLQVIFTETCLSDYCGIGLNFTPDTFSITDLGSKALTNHAIEVKELRREIFMQSRIPIIISLLALLKSYEYEFAKLWQYIITLLNLR